MTIETEDIKRNAAYVLAGSAVSLVAALFVGAFYLLAAEAVAVGGVIAYKKMAGNKSGKREDAVTVDADVVGQQEETK